MRLANKKKSDDEPVTNRDQSIELVANCDQLQESASQASIYQTDIEHFIILFLSNQAALYKSLNCLRMSANERRILSSASNPTFIT